MPDVATIVVSIATSSALAAAASAALQVRFSRSSARWDMKRATCLRALELMDGIYSQTTWGDMVPTPQPAPTMAELRQVQNELALTCKDPDVLMHYRRCLALGGPRTGGALSDLRAAIRKELGFGRSIDSDDESVFLVQIAHSAEWLAAHRAEGSGP